MLACYVWATQNCLPSQQSSYTRPCSPGNRFCITLRSSSARLQGRHPPAPGRGPQLAAVAGAKAGAGSPVHDRRAAAAAGAVISSRETSPVRRGLSCWQAGALLAAPTPQLATVVRCLSYTRHVDPRCASENHGGLAAGWGTTQRSAAVAEHVGESQRVCIWVVTHFTCIVDGFRHGRSSVVWSNC